MKRIFSVLLAGWLLIGCMSEKKQGVSQEVRRVSDVEYSTVTVTAIPGRWWTVFPMAGVV